MERWIDGVLECGSVKKPVFQLGKASKTMYIYSNDVEVAKQSLVIHGTVAAKKAEDGKK